MLSENTQSNYKSQTLNIYGAGLGFRQHYDLLDKNKTSGSKTEQENALDDCKSFIVEENKHLLPPNKYIKGTQEPI